MNISNLPYIGEAFSHEGLPKIAYVHNVRKSPQGNETVQTFNVLQTNGEATLDKNTLESPTLTNNNMKNMNGYSYALMQQRVQLRQQIYFQNMQQYHQQRAQLPLQNTPFVFQTKEQLQQQQLLQRQEQQHQISQQIQYQIQIQNQLKQLLGEGQPVDSQLIKERTFPNQMFPQEKSISAPSSGKSKDSPILKESECSNGKELFSSSEQIKTCREIKKEDSTVVDVGSLTRCPTRKVLAFVDLTEDSNDEIEQEKIDETYVQSMKESTVNQGCENKIKPQLDENANTCLQIPTQIFSRESSDTAHGKSPDNQKHKIKREVVPEEINIKKDFEIKQELGEKKARMKYTPVLPDNPRNARPWIASKRMRRSEPIKQDFHERSRDPVENSKATNDVGNIFIPHEKTECNNVQIVSSKRDFDIMPEPKRCIEEPKKRRKNENPKKLDKRNNNEYNDLKSRKRLKCLDDFLETEKENSTSIKEPWDSALRNPHAPVKKATPLEKQAKCMEAVAHMKKKQKEKNHHDVRRQRRRIASEYKTSKGSCSLKGVDVQSKQLPEGLNDQKTYKSLDKKSYDHSKKLRESPETKHLTGSQSNNKTLDEPKFVKLGEKHFNKHERHYKLKRPKSSTVRYVDEKTEKAKQPLTIDYKKVAKLQQIIKKPTISRQSSSNYCEESPQQSPEHEKKDNQFNTGFFALYKDFFEEER